MEMLPTVGVWSRAQQPRSPYSSSPLCDPHVFFGVWLFLYHFHSIPLTTRLHSGSLLHQERLHFQGSQYFGFPWWFLCFPRSNATLLNAYDLYTLHRTINTSGTWLHSLHSGILSQFHIDSPWTLILTRETYVTIQRCHRTSLDLFMYYNIT